MAMIVPVLIALQTAAAAAPAVPPPALAQLHIAQPCPAAAEGGDEVTVYGRRSAADRYRLKPAAPREEAAALPRAQVRVFGNARLSAEGEAASVGGFVSNRAMVRLKVPF